MFYLSNMTGIGIPQELSNIYRHDYGQLGIEKLIDLRYNPEAHYEIFVRWLGFEESDYSLAINAGPVEYYKGLDINIFVWEHRMVKERR